MSHFSKEKTEIELFVIENFNYDDENPYTSQIEEEGEFVKIPQLIEEEKIDGNTILNDNKQTCKPGE